MQHPFLLLPGEWEFEGFFGDATLDNVVPMKGKVTVSHFEDHWQVHQLTSLSDGENWFDSEMTYSVDLPRTNAHTVVRMPADESTELVGNLCLIHGAQIMSLNTEDHAIDFYETRHFQKDKSYYCRGRITENRKMYKSWNYHLKPLFEIPDEKPPQEQPNDTPETSSDEKPNDTPESSSNEKPNGTPESSSNEKPNGTPESSSNEKPNDTPESSSNEKPNGTPESSSDEKPNDTPKSSSDEQENN